MICPFSSAGCGVERPDHAGWRLRFGPAAAFKRCIPLAYNSIQGSFSIYRRTADGCRYEYRSRPLIEGWVLPVRPAIDAGRATASRDLGNIRRMGGPTEVRSFAQSSSTNGTPIKNSPVTLSRT
jgi:hypothetical protein